MTSRKPYKPGDDKDRAALESVRPQPHWFINRHDLRRLRRMARAGLVQVVDEFEGRFVLSPAGLARLEDRARPVTKAAKKPPGEPRKRPRGEPTSDLIQSSHGGENAPLFAKIMKLHVKRGSRVADVTFGQGSFWRDVDLVASGYELHASDLEAGDDPAKGIAVESITAPIDCRALPYADQSFDCIVLDPPYMEGFYRPAKSQRAGSGSHAAFFAAYSHDGVHAPEAGGPKYHEAVIDLYIRAGIEARRVLRRGGMLIVKTQDEISANKQQLTHVQIITAYESMGFYSKDVFVLTRANAPGVSTMLEQEHARKNHSYFLVFELPRGRARYPRNARVVAPELLS